MRRHALKEIVAYFGLKTLVFHYFPIRKRVQILTVSMTIERDMNSKNIYRRLRKSERSAGLVDRNTIHTKIRCVRPPSYIIVNDNCHQLTYTEMRASIITIRLRAHTFSIQINLFGKHFFLVTFCTLPCQLKRLSDPHNEFCPKRLKYFLKKPYANMCLLNENIVKKYEHE